MGLNTIEAAAVEAARAAPMLAQVERWVAVNSGTRNLDGLATMAGLLADAFAALPGDLTLVEPSPVEMVDTSGTVQSLAHGRHVHLRVRPEAPVQMLFTGHMDTVFPADHPFQSTTWLPDGILNAPGAADMKGGLSLMLAALQAVETTPAAARFGYEVVVNSDEETGSFASAALIAQAAKGKVAALTYEPALPDGTLAGARGGTGNFSIVVRGRSAHAGRNPRDGRNALVAAADLAILRVNFRPASPDAIQRAGAAVHALADAIAADHDVSVHVHGSFNRPPKPLDPGAERLFGLVKQAGADLDISVAWKATGGVCDGNNIAACGVPVVDTMGARGGAIHSQEEFLIADSLPERAALSALTILRIIEKGRV
jgi:glutamate carboxypeptidase